MQMIKTIKALQMYGKSHPSYRSFFAPFFQKISEFLKEYSEFSLKVDRFTMAYADKVIYDEAEKDTSISFRLFRDGIRNITFYEGLTEEELMLFTETISQPAKEQDIALILWECDFAHITFFVVEEEEEPMSYVLPDTPPVDIDYDAFIRDILNREKIDINVNLNPILVYNELEELKQEIETEESRPQLPKAINILIDFLNTEKAQEIIDSLIGLLELCINNNDFYNARRIVHKLQTYPEIKPLERFENETTVTGFSRLCDPLDDKSFNEFVAFIGFFSQKTIPYFIRILTLVKRKERLESLMQRIAYMCQNDLAPVIDFLAGGNVYEVINAIGIAGIMKNRAVIKHLNALAVHPDARVRSALAQTYAELGELKKVAALTDDHDPDVRIKALQMLTLNQYTRIYPELLRRTRQKDFKLLDYTEQKEIFSCMVANGDKKLTRLLEKMLFKRKLFGAKAYRNMRRLAAMGLSQIGTEEAMKTLQAGLNKKNKDIKMACEMVVRG
ncbi:MAG TPA: HEAT repeat domain-containing protein [bacterium]